MKVLFCEYINDFKMLGYLQSNGIESFVPKEEIKDVHEFDRSSLLDTLKNIKPDVLVVVSDKFEINEEVYSHVKKALFLQDVESPDTNLDIIYFDSRKSFIEKILNYSK